MRVYKENKAEIHFIIFTTIKLAAWFYIFGKP